MIILLSLMLISLNVFGAPQETEEVKCPKKVKILAKEIKGTDFNEYRHFSADFKPESIDVKTSVSGKVTDLRVSEGDLVSQDWVIAIVDNALQDQLKTQEGEVSKWQRILKARQNWKERSPRAEAQAQKKVEEESAKLEEMKVNAQDRMIKSPIAGQVVSLPVEKDAEITEGTIFAKIVNSKKMLAVVPIDEEDRALFSVGQQIVLQSDAEAYAKVIAIGDGSVTLFIDNSDKKFDSAATLKFKLLRQAYQDAVVLTKSNVLEDDGGSFVYTVVDKTAKKTYLKTGPVEDNKVLVLEGVNIGDYMIYAEIISLKEGTVREELVCVEDGVRVVVMEKDPETEKFQKAKKVKMMKPAAEEEEEPVEPVEVKKEEVKKEEIKKEEVVEEEKVEEEPVEKVVRNYFSLGLGAGFVNKFDENFKEVYGSGFSGLFHLSYTIKSKFEIFINISHYKKTGIIEVINLESDLLMVPLYVGGKYIFNTSGKIKPYLGLAWAVFNVKETNDFRQDTNYNTSHGMSLLGGVYFSLSNKLDLFGGLRYDIGKVTIEEFNEEADLSGIRFHLGFLFNFSK